MIALIDERVLETFLYFL